MTRRFTITALLITCLLFLAASFATAAEDVLNLVPDSAWGVLLINQPTALDAKFQTLSREMQLPVPSLQAMLRILPDTAGGLDENGTIAVVVMPPEGKEPMPTPIALVPVSDYNKFIKQFRPENTTDEVTKIEIFNSVVWVRNIRGYAALTDSAHRDALEKTLQFPKEAPTVLAPWQEWLTENDVGVVILPSGIKRLQEGLSFVKSFLAQGHNNVETSKTELEIY